MLYVTQILAFLSVFNSIRYCILPCFKWRCALNSLLSLYGSFSDISSLQSLTPAVLIARLINAHRHLLALQISEYLSMNQVCFFAEVHISIKLLSFRCGPIKKMCLHLITTFIICNGVQTLVAHIHNMSVYMICWLFSGDHIRCQSVFTFVENIIN